MQVYILELKVVTMHFEIPPFLTEVHEDWTFLPLLSLESLRNNELRGDCRKHRSYWSVWQYPNARSRTHSSSVHPSSHCGWGECLPQSLTGIRIPHFILAYHCHFTVWKPFWVPFWGAWKKMGIGECCLIMETRLFSLRSCWCFWAKVSGGKLSFDAIVTICWLLVFKFGKFWTLVAK